MIAGFRIVAVLALVALLSPHSTFGQSASEVQEQIREHNTQIAELNNEIAEYERELSEVGAQKQTLQNILAQIDLSRRKIAASINVTKNRIGTLQLEIQNLSQGITTAEGAINVNKEGLGETIRRLHEAESKSLAVLVLSSNNLSSVWDDIEATRRLQEAMQEDIDDLSEQKATLTDIKDVTLEKRSQLQVQQNNLVAERGSLDATRRAQNELLAQTKSKESNYQDLLEEKRAAKIAFESALEDLESQLEFILDPSRIPAAGRGILRWPLANSVNSLCGKTDGRNTNCLTQLFGKTSSSGRLYASGTHNGIDFRASIGTPLKAALSGTVVGTGNTDGGGCYSYGKWVLIQHGNGLSTLYAHLSQIDTSKGSTVSTGDLIGYTGFTGYATGPHLHFTVFASEGVTVQNLGDWYRDNGYSVKTACVKKGAIIPVAARSAYLDPLDYL